MVTKVKGNGTSTFGGAISANNVSAVIPAFRAYNAGTQSITASTNTKCIFNSEDFDTANCFDSTTNYRFTPQVAGYYQFNAVIRNRANGALSNAFGGFFKNGTEYNRLSGPQIASATLGQIHASSGSTVAYLNGTTDYIEVYGLNSTSTNNRFGGESNLVVTVFSGILIQQA